MIARCYRKYQLGRGAAVPLAEKAKTNPALAYAVTNMEVRIRQAWKPAPSPVLEQVTRNEPPVKAQWVKPFDPPKNEMVDGYIPLWQLVYHGIIVSTPFRMMINCPANSL